MLLNRNMKTFSNNEKNYSINKVKSDIVDCEWLQQDPSHSVPADQSLLFNI